jgi:hypothetical protein
MDGTCVNGPAQQACAEARVIRLQVFVGLLTTLKGRHYTDWEVKNVWVL